MSTKLTAKTSSYSSLPVIDLPTELSTLRGETEYSAAWHHFLGGLSSLCADSKVNEDYSTTPIVRRRITPDEVFNTLAAAVAHAKGKCYTRPTTSQEGGK